MTDTTTPSVCPNCQHPHHLPGTECATPVHHGPNRWHLCLCLARPGAALSCPPQMTCQGGTLGYADVWYLQHGHVLVGEDGTIAPGAVQTGVASVGFPSGPDIAAAASAVVPAADRAAAVCICGHTEQQHFEDVCITEITGCDCGDFMVPEAAREVIARWREAATRKTADRAAVLEEAADALGRMDYDTDSNDYGYDTYRDAWNGGVMDGADLLRRMAVESAAVDRVAAETPEPETGCAHCGGPHDWADCEEYTALVAAEGPAVEAQPGKDTETPQPKEA